MPRSVLTGLPEAEPQSRLLNVPPLYDYETKDEGESLLQSAALMSVLKDSSEEHTAHMHAGLVTKDSEMGSYLANHPNVSISSDKSGLTGARSLTSHLTWEQAHPQPGQKYRGAVPASCSQHFRCQICSELQKCRGRANMSR